jgi:metal-responsive CopG/Arc/MetJ family transcriptional regulator
MEMLMNKVLISIPDEIASRMRAMIPSRQRSKVIVNLIEKEIKRREQQLYHCAVAVEQDAALHKEMEDWDVTVQDGLSDESW